MWPLRRRATIILLLLTHDGFHVVISSNIWCVASNNPTFYYIIKMKNRVRHFLFKKFWQQEIAIYLTSKKLFGCCWSIKKYDHKVQEVARSNAAVEFDSSWAYKDDVSDAYTISQYFAWKRVASFFKLFTTNQEQYEKSYVLVHIEE